MTVPEKIQEIMEWSNRKKLTQLELARLSGISKSSLNGYIHGDRKITVDAAQKIADALNVSLWTLLNGEALAVTSMDLTERERRLVSGYRRLNDEQRAAVGHGSRSQITKEPAPWGRALLLSGQHSSKPAGTLSSSISRWSRSLPSTSFTAEMSIPLDSRPIIFRGARLTQATRVLPTRSSGS